MKYLVTGGCGFIGSHLAKTLIDQNHDVRVLDNLSSGRLDNLPHGAEFHLGDINRREDVAKSMDGMDGCFHLAAIASVELSRLHWTETHLTNVAGTINMFEAAARTKMPVVYASSAAVFGPNPDLPLSESSLTMPMSAYGVDKLSCEWHGQIAWLIHGVPNVGLRFFNVYGPGQDPSSMYSGVISIFAKRAAEGAPLTIYGDGSQSRDFIYVGDVVAHLLASMQHARSGNTVYNVCTGKATTLLMLADALERITGRPIEKQFAAPRAGDIPASLGDPSHAITYLGVRAEVPLEAGLKQTLEM